MPWNNMKQSQLEQDVCSKRRSTGESGPNEERPSPAKNLHEWICEHSRNSIICVYMICIQLYMHVHIHVYKVFVYTYQEHEVLHNIKPLSQRRNIRTRLQHVQIGCTGVSFASFTGRDYWCRKRRSTAQYFFRLRYIEVHPRRENLETSKGWLSRGYVNRFRGRTGQWANWRHALQLEASTTWMRAMIWIETWKRNQKADSRTAGHSLFYLS